MTTDIEVWKEVAAELERLHTQIRDLKRKRHTGALEEALLAMAKEINGENVLAVVRADKPWEAVGRFVRGPSRPSGSGWKNTVLELPNNTKARMTANTLNDFFSHFAQQKEPS